MNELKQIRSMAEMILEKVTALEGANTFSQNSFSEFGPKFKVGDSVCTTVGEAGKITGIHKLDGHYRYRYRYLVLFDNGDHHHVVESLLQLIKPEPKFRVGDRVVYQSSGEQGTVIDASIGSMGIEYIVWQPDNKFAQPHTSTPAADLVKAPKFKVGDRVVGDFDRTTKIGTITLQYGSGGEWYVVEWDDRTTNSVSIHDKHSDNIRLATKDDREWHSGPPPHIGWWNASYYNGHNRNMSWRWWNGEYWSHLVFPFDSIVMVGISSGEFDDYQDKIEWSDYWPENARVPRIDPENSTDLR